MEGCGMRRILLVGLVVFTVVFGVAARADDDDKELKLDDLSIDNHAAWSCARTIAIGSVKVPKDFKGARTKEEYIAFYTDLLASGFTAMPGIAEVVILKPGEVPSTDLVVETDFSDLTTGSRAARFWIGFGAGRSKAGLKMVARMTGSGQEVFKLEHARLSAMGLKKDEVAENITETVADIVKVLARERGGCPNPALFPAAPPKVATEARGARVALESLPKDAEVYVDGRFVGNAPVAAYLLPAGKHVLEFRMKGMTTWTREVEVAEGQETRFLATLEPEGTAPQPAVQAPEASPTPPPAPEAPAPDAPTVPPSQEAPPAPPPEPATSGGGIAG
jgi:hypothetical protein